MNIELDSKGILNQNSDINLKKNNSSVSSNFAEEMSHFTSEKKELQNVEDVEEEKCENVDLINTDETKVPEVEVNKDVEEIDDVQKGLEDVVKEIHCVNHKDEKYFERLKNNLVYSDDKQGENLSEVDLMINNDMNVNESKENLMPQMSSSMNFSGNGESFSNLMKDNGETSKNKLLSQNIDDLIEEQNILSSMDENIAIANKNTLINTYSRKINDDEKEPISSSKDALLSPKDITDYNISNKLSLKKESKIIYSNDGIKKVDKDSSIEIETIAKFDTVMMSKSDVDFFVELVEKGKAEVTTKNLQVSKTLADLIAKAMNDNKPVRIDFDNNISVIIKISREGKITADFLPSSQVAEAYLKENLPLLRQRFDEQNIDYDELNQKGQKQEERNNKKKDRKDE